MCVRSYMHCASMHKIFQILDTTFTRAHGLANLDHVAMACIRFLHWFNYAILKQISSPEAYDYEWLINKLEFN